MADFKHRILDYVSANMADKFGLTRAMLVNGEFSCSAVQTDDPTLSHTHALSLSLSLSLSLAHSHTHTVHVLSVSEELGVSLLA